LLNQGQNKLYTELINIVPKNVLTTKNKAKTWTYGFNDKYNFVVISKTGQIGQIINVSGLNIALPKISKNILERSNKKENQYWEAKILPKVLGKIKSIFQWHNTPSSFKNQWVDYIENEFNYREQGCWFMNKGEPTYMTGTHTCIYNGQKLMLDFLILEKQIEYFIFFGKLAKLIKEVLD